MKTRTRVVLLAAVLAAAIPLAGCTPPEAPVADESGPVELASLQFVNPLPGTPIWGQIGECIGEQAEAAGLEFTESGPPVAQAGDPTVMIQQIQDATAAGVDAIITFPASAAFGPVLQDAQAAGVVTATLYGDGSPESGATVNAGVDWATIAAQYVDAIAAQPGEQVVGLVAEAPTGVGKSWIDGVKAAAEATDNVTIVGEVFIGSDASKALPEVTNLLSAYPEINIVATNTGFTTAGAVAAIESLGLRDSVHLLTINNGNGGPEAVRDGIAIGLFLQDLCDLGKRTVDGVLAAAAGEDVPLIQVNAVVATKENLDEYLDKGFN